MRISEILTEGLQHPVIVVDVQPEYAHTSNEEICARIVQFVNKQTGPVLMFVNADETGMSDDTVTEIVDYWNNTICPEDDRYTYDEEYDEYVENENCPAINWKRFQIVDKGFGFFRSWMDSGISHSAIIRVIRAMYQNRLNDSRDFEDTDISLEKLVGSEWDAWMWNDSIYINWANVAQLKRFSGAYLVGGGRNECLKEVELLMNAFNIRYRRIDSLIYGD